MAYTKYTNMSTPFYGGPMTPEGIAVHHWDDPLKNPQFWPTVNYLVNVVGPRQIASVHYVAQAREVAQILSTSVNSWGQGDGGNGWGNLKCVAIECNPRCSPEDRETVAELIADIRDEEGWRLPLYPHQHFTSTSCPGRWMAWLGWLDTRAEEIRANRGRTNAPTLPAAPTSSIRKVTRQGALVRKGPGTNFPALDAFPEGFAVGAPLAVVGYVKGQDPFNDNNDAWFKTEGNGFIWANNAGDDLRGLKYLGDLTPKVTAPKPPQAPSAPAKGLKNTDKQWIFSKGETLSQAAKFFNCSVAELAKFNGIKDVNKIKVGDNVWPPIPGAGLWIVDPGDTLTKIAKHYGVTVAHVKAANGLSSTRLKVGQRIIVP